MKNKNLEKISRENIYLSRFFFCHEHNPQRYELSTDTLSASVYMNLHFYFSTHEHMGGETSFTD